MLEKMEFKMSDMKNLQEQRVIWKKGRNLNESVINEQERKRDRGSGNKSLKTFLESINEIENSLYLD